MARLRICTQRSADMLEELKTVRTDTATVTKRVPVLSDRGNFAVTLQQEDDVRCKDRKASIGDFTPM